PTTAIGSLLTTFFSAAASYSFRLRISTSARRRTSRGSLGGVPLIRPPARVRPAPRGPPRRERRETLPAARSGRGGDRQGQPASDDRRQGSSAGRGRSRPRVRCAG